MSGTRYLDKTYGPASEPPGAGYRSAAASP